MSDIVPSNQGDLLPVLNPADAKRAYHAYLELCQAILVPYDKRIVDNRGVVTQESDYARIKQTKKDDAGKWITEYVDAPKKSAFRKLGKFYGISDEIMEKSKEIHENGSFTYHYTVRAIGPNGVHSDGEGSCSSSEKGGKSEHDTRSTAHTRAKSRAISDLIGFGQVSAEEYGNYEEADKKPEYREAQIRPDHNNLKAFFEAKGFDPERFTITEDEPTGIITIRIKGFIKDIGPVMDEIPAYWSAENKCYVVSM